MVGQRVTPRLLLQVKDLASQECFTWEIMKITGLSESTISKIRQGRYDEQRVHASFGQTPEPEHEPPVTEPPEVEPPQVEWCPRCRCHIFPPCQLCRARTHRRQVLRARAKHRPATLPRGADQHGSRAKLRLNVAELGLPIRTVNYLQRAGIETVEDLLHCTPEELLRIPNFAGKSLRLTYQALARLGFQRRASARRNAPGDCS